MILIGRENFRRPPVGGSAVYRRGWGLLLGHCADVGTRAPGRRSEEVVDGAKKRDGKRAESKGPAPEPDSSARELD